MSTVDSIKRPITISDTQAEQLLHDLVAIPSPSNQEAEAVHFLVSWMRAHGYDNAYVDEAGNAVGCIGKGRRDIILLGHIDTFVGNPPVRSEGRLLYGRGSVDAKGPLCAFAVAAAQAQVSSDTRLVVVGAVEEESRSSRGARHIAAHYRPALCVIGEPSRWDRITLGYKGRLVLEWNWHGALAHSAGSVLSPAEHAVNYWQNILTYTEQFNADRTRIFDTLDATMLDINTGQDGAYGWAKMTIGFRLPPGLHPQTVADELQPQNEATVRAYGMEQAVTSEKDSILSRVLRAAIRQEGGVPAFVHKTGTADMNVVAPVWNCPIVAYGPGDSSLDHTPNEHVDLGEYLRAIRVLKYALERL